MDAQTVVLQKTLVNVDNYTNYLLSYLNAVVVDSDMKKTQMMMMMTAQ